MGRERGEPFWMQWLHLVVDSIQILDYRRHRKEGLRWSCLIFFSTVLCSRCDWMVGCIGTQKGDTSSLYWSRPSYGSGMAVIECRQRVPQITFASLDHIPFLDCFVKLAVYFSSTANP